MSRDMALPGMCWQRSIVAARPSIIVPPAVFRVGPPLILLGDDRTSGG
jgi:hypothetical protein